MHTIEIYCRMDDELGPVYNRDAAELAEGIGTRDYYSILIEEFDDRVPFHVSIVFKPLEDSHDY